MKQCIEGSQAVAKVIQKIKPDVVSAFPITPQTHIVESLAKMRADGQADFEFINSDSEFAAASIVLGASATGGRVYTATSSQGLLLMAEVLINIAGMRLPVVVTCANRAISAPINIWNDQQDSLTIRDSGWMMLYAKDNQAAADLQLFAYKIAEKLRVPVMVNMDGFVLTHTYEVVDIPSQEQVDKFLPAYKPQEGQFLDVQNPVTLGSFATPDDYQEIRLELHEDLKKSLALFKKQAGLFNKIFKRKYNLVEYIGPAGAKTVLVTFGSLAGTIEATLKKLNEKKSTTALLNVVCYRPFPDKEAVKALAFAKKIIVIEKDLSMGAEGCLATDLKRALYGQSKAQFYSYAMGLGGRDIRQKDIVKIVNQVNKKR